MEEGSLNPVIFKTYDLRGIAGKDISLQEAYLIGRGFGTIMRRTSVTKICVGRDGRLSSVDLAKHLIQGLVDAGIHVVDVGLGPTPYVCWAEDFLQANAAIVVTGSHNPPEENGFKFSLHALPFYGKDLQRLFRLVGAEDFIHGTGVYEKKNLLSTYAQSLKEQISWGLHALSVAWDPGHGAMGAVLPFLLKDIPGTHVVIHARVDGRFPKRSPDPDHRSLAPLQRLIHQHKCHVGFAFDGGGDRLVVVDNQGNIWSGDETLAFFAPSVLRDNKSNPVVLDFQCSRVLKARIASLFSGQILPSPPDHSSMKDYMKSQDALLGGTFSGRFFFRDRHPGYNDGAYSALRALMIMSRTLSVIRSLSHWRNQLPPHYTTGEIQLFCPFTQQYGTMEKIKTHLHAHNIPFHEHDGVCVENAQHRWIVRTSQAQPALMIYCEALTEDGCHQLKKNTVDLVKDCLQS